LNISFYCGHNRERPASPNSHNPWRYCNTCWWPLCRGDPLAGAASPHTCVAASLTLPYAFLPQSPYQSASQLANVQVMTDAYTAVQDAHGIAVLTEWDEVSA